jgi:hypothetical protein
MAGWMDGNATHAQYQGEQALQTLSWHVSVTLS